MDDNRKGALLVILAGTCWGVISIFINYLSAAGLGEMQISFLRQLFAVLVFALVILVRDRSKFRILLKDLALLMLVGFINGVLFNFLYFYTIINSRASIAVVLLYTSPVFVIILARIFFGEKITRNKFIALVLTVTFYTLFFSFLFLIPFSGWGSLTSLCRANPMILVVAFLMCLVTAVFAQYFFSMGLKLIESGKAAIYGATEPIVGSLVGILIFHEESNLMKIAGIIMVIAAILLIGKSDAGKEEDTR